MKSSLPLLLAALAAAFLAGCNAAPATTQPMAATALPAVATEPVVEVLPTETPTAPAAATAPFPTIDLLKMVDEANGWASDFDGKLYRTVDGGASWYVVTTPADVPFTAYGSAFLSPDDAWLSYYDASGAPALLRTSDGGATWAPLTDIGLADAGGPASFEFSTPEDGLATVAGVGAGNLYLREFETHDAGASFNVIPLVGPRPEDGLPEGTVHLCNICTDAFYYDPDRAIVVEGDMATMQPRGAVHLQRSTDLGQHWTETTLPLPSGYEDALVSGLPLAFPQGQHGFLPVRLMKYNADNSAAYDVIAVYETVDGGANWSMTPSVIPGVTDPGTLQFVDDLDAVAVCRSSLCETHDAAYTWQTITPDIALSNTDARSIVRMSFVDPLRGWMVVRENESYLLYKTVDGGATWTLLNP